jgi:hypothetical protein
MNNNTKKKNGGGNGAARHSALGTVVTPPESSAALALAGPEQEVVRKLDSELVQLKVELADLDLEMARGEARRHELRVAITAKREQYVADVRAMARAKGINDNQPIKLDVKSMMLFAEPQPQPV